ncbi:hypothetical protein BJ170DRAFT_579822 [Xylariales sp. AK1849]|nr:hypothetical protein BJ170DRAFT_579822 [Xylariales sp. AK1849]
MGQATVKSEPLSPPPQIIQAPKNYIEGHLDFTCLKQALTETSADSLEKYALRAKATLDELISPLNKVKDNFDATRFLKLINNLKSGFQPKRTIIGVVGDTGAGKSSLVNALLQEGKVVPTNCLRACTAVVTEISWNESNDPGELFRAEIDFISTDDWCDELQHLFKDLVDSNGEISKNSTNKETEAGVAWAKIKSIYPHIGKDELAETNAKDLARHGSICNILGTTREIKAASAVDLHQRTQRYIDSKEKIVLGKKKANAAQKAAEHGFSELWPLIKVVRIFTKSDILSTGAVLVDLPGLGDSNAARASIADKYLEKCTGIWITAPIIRAVDNKTAQHLLGETFRMQLKYDGSFSSVSFICSQTDDILVADAAESLGLSNELAESLAFKERYDEELVTKEAEIEHLRNNHKELKASKDGIEKKLRTWERLAINQAKGQKVFAPLMGTRKRKQPADESEAPRKRQSQHLRPLDSDDDNTNEGEDTTVGPDAEPLTSEHIETMIRQLDSEESSVEEKIKAVKHNCADLGDRLKNLTDKYNQQQSNLKSLCIQRRNEYSRTAIQEHFALGIQLLDQDTAMKEDASSFNPDHSIRDYDEVARSLPVFCVSSRAYQVKTGKLNIRDDFDGFANLEQTEVPQLVAHAKKLTESGRATNCKKFLNGCLQIMQSLQIWAGTESIEVVLSDSEAKAEVEKLVEDLNDLRKALESAAAESTSKCQAILEKDLFRKFGVSISKTASQATSIAEKWGAPKDEGGYHCNTYKATVSRRGQFKRKKGGEINFNEDLVAPLKRYLAASWERTFARKLPTNLQKFAALSEQAMISFHQNVRSRMHDSGAGSRMNLLQTQLQVYIQGIKDTQAVFEQTIQEMQREASRAFTPGVRDMMAKAYGDCIAEKGAGCFSRMKTIMVEHVSKTDYDIFEESAKQVRNRLSDMCGRYGDDLADQISITVDNMTSDYTNSIRKRDVAVSESIRSEVMEIISKADDEPQMV